MRMRLARPDEPTPLHSGDGLSPPVQQHGGLRTDELRAHGFDPADVIDFSASINPYGPSPRVGEALARVDLARYPDPLSLELTEALAARLGVPPDCILVGNGASELIHLVVRVFVRQGQRAVAFTPTFGEFERACNLQHWSDLPSGGHFAALEEPAALVEDIRAFFRPLRKG